MTQQAPPPIPMGIFVPDEMEAGVYAHIVSVWHTPTEFTLDFLTMVPGGVPIPQPDGTVATGQKLRVVSRVKLPPQQIFELMKALESQLSAHEREQQAQPSEQPLYPPFMPDDDDEGDTGDASPTEQG